MVPKTWHSKNVNIRRFTIQKILVFDAVSVISPFGKMIPEEALDTRMQTILCG